MADTTKIYENIFIKKNAAGDREYIKVPYAILADPPTIPDVSGFMPKSGGTFIGDVTFNKKINLGQGDANCLYLGSDGRLNGPENRTLFGLVSGATTFGHQAYSLHFRGSAARPQYTTDGSNYKDLALKSDIPAAVTESTVSGWGFTKNKGTVTSVAVKMNGVSKGTVTSSGTIDLGTVLTNASAFATSAQGTKADNAMPKSGGTFTGNISVPKTITFTDETNPFIKMRTGGTDFYFQSTSGQFGLGPTWDKATHWDSNGNVTFPTVPKVGNSSLALKSDISGKQDKLTAGSNITISGNTISATVPTMTFDGTTLTINL